MRRLRSDWKHVYIAFSLAAYLICAVLINLVGALEYGWQEWFGMARVWSGFFVWPIFFLPFSLLAIYRPLTVVLETATTCGNLRDAARYLTPVAVGTMLAVLAVIFEVGGKYETPWTIHPIQPGCEQGGAPPAAPALAALSYDRAGTLQQSYDPQPFWLKDKCWPNVFFYLTVPAYQGSSDADYKQERPGVQRTYLEVLRGDISAPYSRTFYVYVLSFAILIWLGTTGVVLSIFHVAVQIRRPLDNMLLQIQREDAYLCMTYAFVTLILWIPFRMNTVFFEDLYFCPQLPCTGDPVNYMHDFVLGAMLLLGYLYLTTGLLLKYRGDGPSASRRRHRRIDLIDRRRSRFVQRGGRPYGRAVATLSRHFDPARYHPGGTLVSVRSHAGTARGIQGDRLMWPYRHGRTTMPWSTCTFLPALVAVGLVLPLLVLTGDALAAEVVYEFHAERQEVHVPRGLPHRVTSSSWTPTIRRARGLTLDDKGLTIETLGSAEPLIARPISAIPQPARLVITWGVDRYPTGANGDSGSNNEAVMVMISFGTQKYSGGLFVPASPYFIGFFLCDKGRRGVPITGRSYGTQWRYICIDGPLPGREVTSVIALDRSFHSAFPSTPMLPVTGVALEADTTQVSSRSSAWIKSIRITTMP